VHESQPRALRGRRVVVGVSGGIAAYKVAGVVSRLVQAGGDVRVIMTPSATRFVGPLTFRTLSGHPVYTDMFDPPPPEWRVLHLGLAEHAELLLIAPATADIIARLAHGLADDLLGAVALATKAPVLVAPAMNAAMYRHRAVQDNLEVLRRRGVTILEPDSGPLACGATGPGRLPEPDDLVEAVRRALPGGEGRLR